MIKYDSLYNVGRNQILYFEDAFTLGRGIVDFHLKVVSVVYNIIIYQIGLSIHHTDVRFITLKIPFSAKTRICFKNNYQTFTVKLSYNYNLLRLMKIQKPRTPLIIIFTRIFLKFINRIYLFFF
jgi:hypothetical protein